MIELNLGEVVKNLMWDLKVLAAIRAVCVSNEMPVDWVASREEVTAGLVRSVRKIVAVKGDVMQIRERGD